MSTSEDMPDAPESVHDTVDGLVDALRARIECLRDIKLEQRERIAVLTAERDAARAEVERLRALWESDPTAAAIRARDEAITEGRRAVMHARVAAIATASLQESVERLTARAEKAERECELLSKQHDGEIAKADARADKAELALAGSVQDTYR